MRVWQRRALGPHILTAMPAHDPLLPERCETLRSLHVPGTPIVMPNAWDVGSARAMAAAGFPAIATTSGGVAGSLGFEDHERAPRVEMLRAAARIVGSVAVPVTVDAEAGYGLSPSRLVHALESMGAAGVNLEDTDHTRGSLRDPREQARWLGSVRRAAERRGFPLVINARVDVFLGAAAPTEAMLREAVARAGRYLEAGADCVYPILLRDMSLIAEFVGELGACVNVMAIPPLEVDALASVGVARVTFGTRLYRETMESLGQRLASLADRDRA